MIMGRPGLAQFGVWDSRWFQTHLAATGRIIRMTNTRESKGSRIWPVATLLVLATVLPELFSGSTPPAGFVNPGVVVFLFFGYGVPVLLVREFAVR